MNKSIVGLLASACVFTIPALAQELAPFIHPVYRSIAEFHGQTEFDAVLRALAAGKLATVPTWSGGFKVEGTSYNYTLIGAKPRSGEQTVVPVIIVPLRLTIEGYKVNGKPLVLDATKTNTSVEGSPIFYPSFYVSGVRQFGDAMLHAEFANAPKAWSTMLSPSVAPAIDITIPKGEANVLQAKSGELIALIRDDTLIDRPIAQWTRENSSPESLVIFNTYNALEHDAFGYHSFVYSDQKSEALLYIYDSWLEGAGDVLGIPSPNAVTLSHEVAETIHDPLGTSLTRRWGDAFNRNRCFQRFIEVGDAVEDAKPILQFYDQWGNVNGKPKLFVLQNEAMLPWFERQTPSHALGHAYSFPGNQALRRAAPVDCKKA